MAALPRVLVGICAAAPDLGADRGERGVRAPPAGRGASRLGRPVRVTVGPRRRTSSRGWSHAPGPSGSPILGGAAGWLDCRVEARLETGDRTVYLAEVVDARRAERRARPDGPADARARPRRRSAAASPRTASATPRPTPRRSGSGGRAGRPTETADRRRNADDGTEHARGVRPVGGLARPRRARAALVPERDGSATSTPGAARPAATLLAKLMQPETGGTPEAELQHRFEYDGLTIEHLHWQLPYGPPTEAYLLKPAGARGRLPGRPRPARPRRQQVFRHPQDRPPRRTSRTR